jgi:SAM-dependent methyltransferase
VRHPYRREYLKDFPVADDDIPSPIDFHDETQARQWVEDTVRKRPWRPRFFAAFAKALSERFRGPFTALELGSGPGHLAQEVLGHTAVSHYAALDFSAAMHRLAVERLAGMGERCRFIERDFRKLDWRGGLGPFDAVLTMQAAHELRHKRHLVPFFREVLTLVKPRGLFLYCDHYAAEGRNGALYLERDAQALALEEAGFGTVQRLLDEGGMALYAAEAPAR